MSWLTHILDTVESSIRDVHVVFTLHIGYDQVTDSQWTALDAAFTRPPLASVSRVLVEWIIYPVNLHEDEGVAFENLVKSKLPILNGRKIKSEPMPELDVLEVRPMKGKRQPLLIHRMLNLTLLLDYHADLFSLDPY